MNETGIPTIFSPSRTRLRAERATALRTARTEAADWFIDAMVEDLCERIAFMRIEPRRALVQGIGAQQVADALPATCETIVEGIASERALDAGGYDLVVNLAQLDTVNDVPGQLIRVRRALAPGGIFLAVIPGAGSLPKLRGAMIVADGDRAFPRIHPQIDNRAATMLLERAGFARQVVDSFSMTVRYGSLPRLVRDLREQGLGSALANPPPALGKSALARAAEAFAAAADEDGKVSEQFELLALTGWNR